MFLWMPAPHHPKSKFISPNSVNILLLERERTVYPPKQKEKLRSQCLIHFLFGPLSTKYSWFPTKIGTSICPSLIHFLVKNCVQNQNLPPRRFGENPFLGVSKPGARFPISVGQQSWPKGPGGSGGEVVNIMGIQWSPPKMILHPA